MRFKTIENLINRYEKYKDNGVLSTDGKRLLKDLKTALKPCEYLKDKIHNKTFHILQSDNKLKSAVYLSDVLELMD